MAFKKIHNEYDFYAIKSTTYLSIDEVLKRSKEIPTSRLEEEEGRKTPKVDGGETTVCSDQNEALDKLYNVSQRSKVRRSH